MGLAMRVLCALGGGAVVSDAFVGAVVALPLVPCARVAGRASERGGCCDGGLGVLVPRDRVLVELIVTVYRTFARV